MSKTRLVFSATVALVVLGAGLWLGVSLSRWAGASPGPKMLNTATVLQQVKTLSELVTVQYVMEKVVVLEVPADNIIGKMVGSQDRVLLLAHGIVKAGINLQRLAPEDLQVNGKKVTIKLPPAEITGCSLDEGLTKVIDRTTGLFTSFDKNLEQTARQHAVEDISRAARTSGILKDADDRARAQVKNLFTQLGFEEVEFLPR
jgi:hypothetical protein